MFRSAQTYDLTFQQNFTAYNEQGKKKNNKFTERFADLKVARTYIFMKLHLVLLAFKPEVNYTEFCIW